MIFGIFSLVVGVGILILAIREDRFFSTPERRKEPEALSTEYASSMENISNLHDEIRAAYSNTTGTNVPTYHTSALLRYKKLGQEPKSSLRIISYSGDQGDLYERYSKFSDEMRTKATRMISLSRDFDVSLLVDDNKQAEAVDQPPSLYKFPIKRPTSKRDVN